MGWVEPKTTLVGGEVGSGGTSQWTLLGLADSGLLDRPQTLSFRQDGSAGVRMGEVEGEGRVAASMNDIIELDVGGARFETSRQTLLHDPGSMLARMFDPVSPLSPGQWLVMVAVGVWVVRVWVERVWVGRVLPMTCDV